MIVGNLDIENTRLTPNKTYPPLFIDPNAMLPGTVSRQGLQAISRGTSKGVKTRSGVQKLKLTLDHRAYVTPAAAGTPEKNLLRVFASEGPNHVDRLYRTTINVKR